MLKSVNPEDIESARAYDKMIPWKPRLKREIPFLVETLPKGLILDVACATGRHSFELEKHGYSTVGIDISAAMIAVSEENAKEIGASARFHVTDAAAKDFHAQLGEQPLVYDGAIMLGNAIANTENLQNVKKVLDNVMSVVRPGGVFVMQTIYRPLRPYYLPLRKSGEYMLQRIMIPVGRERQEPHNVELNVNVIDEGYVNQSVANLYMLTNDELREYATAAGWKVEAVYSSYNKDPERCEDGATAVWVLRRPDLEFSEQTRQILGITDNEIQERALRVWEDVKRVRSYRSMQNFKFLHPRVSENPFLEDLIQRKSVLDIGCGVGADLRYLKFRGVPRVDGLDVTDGFMRQGEKLFGPHDGRLLVGNVGDQLRNLQGETVELGKYDAVHAGSVIHLVDPEELPQFLKAVGEALDNDGIFVARTIAGKEIQEADGELRAIMSIKRLNEMLQEAGFGNIQWKRAERTLKRASDIRNYDVYFLMANVQKS